MGGGEREIIYLSLHCHHQNDSCIQMGSDESHFNVSVGSDGQSQKTVSTNHNLKPVLNWANVCSPNILRTVRRTMIRFLIELLVHRKWFGQSKLYFVLNWLVMRCKLRPELCGRRAADSMIQNVD